MSQDSSSIQLATTQSATLKQADHVVRPEKIQTTKEPTAEVVDTRPVENPKVDPAQDIARLDQIGDRSLAIAADTYSIDRIREKVEELEAALPKTSNALMFQVDEVLNRPIITVVDKNSGEIVRTLPSDEVLRVVHNMDKMKGILFEDEF